MGFLSKALGRRALRRQRPGHRSRFGGLWTDKPNALDEVARELAAGVLSSADADALTLWIKNGFWIHRGAVPHAVIDGVIAATDEVWQRTDGVAQVEFGGEYVPLSPELRVRNGKLVDLHALAPAALEAALAPTIRNFLELVFRDRPLLFQSLSFEHGSEQPLHQDTAFVVVAPPLEFVASWIALEDIRPGSGELTYVPGSPALPEYTFAGGTRNWNAKRDGVDARARYGEHLTAQIEHLELEPQSFLPRKGDVLFWSADLVHGGTPITTPGVTRKSFVCHYCPQRATPYYMFHRPDRRERVLHGKDGAAGAYSSSHYGLDGNPS